MYLDAVLRTEEHLKNALLYLKLKVFEDKELSLDERWQAFTKVAHLMPTEPYGDGQCEVLFGVPCYDAGIERHQTMSYATMYEWYLDRVHEKTLYPDDDYHQNVATQEVADAWREDVLASNYGSFTHDW